VVQGASGQTANVQEWRDASGNVLASIAANGATTFKNNANSTTAFRVQNASNTSLFTVDTTNNYIRFINGSIIDSLGAFMGNYNTYIRAGAGGSIKFTNSALNEFASFGQDGIITFKNVSNSTSALSVQNAAASSILQVDTLNSRVGIKNSSPTNPLTVGVLTSLDSTGQLAVSTNGINNKGIIIQATAGQTANLQEWQDNSGGALARVTATGQIFQGVNQVCDTSNNCNYAPNSGSGNYIQNQVISPQVAGFNISGNGTLSRLNLNDSIVDNRNNVILQQSISSVLTNRTLQLGNATYWSQWFVLTASGSVGIGSDAKSMSGTVGRLTVTNGSTSIPGIVVRGITSQTADSVQIQNSSGTTVASISATGQIFQGINQVCDTSNNCNYAPNSGSGNYIQNQVASPQAAGFKISGSGYVGGTMSVGTNSNTGQLNIASDSASRITAIIQGSSGQAANLQEWQNSSGTPLLYVDSAGSLYQNQLPSGSKTVELANGVYIFRGASGATNGNYVKIRPDVGNTAYVYGNTNLVLQSESAGANISVNAGIIISSSNAGHTTVALNTSGGNGLTVFGSNNRRVASFSNNNPQDLGARVNITTDYAGTKGVVIRGYTSQSATLQEWQASDGSAFAIMGNSQTSGLTIKDVVGGTNGSAVLSVDATGAGSVCLRNGNGNTKCLVNDTSGGNYLRSTASFIAPSFRFDDTTVSTQINQNQINMPIGGDYAITRIGWSGGNNGLLVHSPSNGSGRPTDPYAIYYGDFTFNSVRANQISVTIKGASAQTSDLLQAQDSLGNVLASISSTGDLKVKSLNVDGAYLTLSSNISGKNVAVSASSTSINITFPTPHPDANYAVFCTPNWGTTCWASAKATTGFTLNFGTAAPSSQQVDWLVTR